MIDGKTEYIVSFFAAVGEFDKYSATVNEIFKSMQIKRHKPILWDLCLKTYENHELGFIFRYPECWETCSDVKLGTLVQFRGTSVTQMDNDGRVKIDFSVSIVDKPTPNISLDDYTKLYKLQLEKMMLAPEIITNQKTGLKRSQLSGRPAKLITYNNKDKKHMHLFVTSEDENILCLTFVFSVLQDEERLPKIFPRILDSFKFIKTHQVSIPFTQPSGLMYEHIGDKFGLPYDDVTWRLLPQPECGVVFLRRKREETSRILIIRESADHNKTLSTALTRARNSSEEAWEELLVEELKLKIDQQKGVVESRTRRDITLASLPARNLHFVARYHDRVVHTVIQFFVVNNNHAYIMNFGCLDQNFVEDWPKAQQMLAQFYLFD